MARLPKGRSFEEYTKPSFEFWFAPEYYTVQGAETMMSIATKDDMSTIRTEYTRMRDAAQKRLKRLEEKFPEASALQAHTGGFKKLRELDPRDLPKAFADLAKFLKSEGSTVTGQLAMRNRVIEKWQDQGLNLTQKNYDRVFDIMEEMRKQKLVHGSKDAVKAAEVMLNFNRDAQEKWMEHLETFLNNTEVIESIPDKESVDIDELIELLEG